MNDSIKLTMPFPPSANRYWRKFRNRMVKSDEARNYCELVRNTMESQMIDGTVAISMHFYRPAKRGDLANREKVLSDSLQGILYKDDKQIVEMHLYQDDDKTNPRVEVEIWPKNRG